MMPFAGGSFGYVRCTSGPVTGYLVGCCEAAEYILYVASAVVEIGRLLTVITQLSPSFEPLYWISFYAISLMIQMKGGRIFWGFNRIIAIITVLLIIVYCLASLPNVDFAKFAVSSEDHQPGLSQPSKMFEEIFHFFPLVSWFYVGVESMTLACDDIPQANRRVPWMMVCSMLTLFLTSCSIVLTSCSQYPGTEFLAYADLPLSPGYSKIFQYASPRLLAILAMPGTFSTSFGFMFAYGRQLKAMARSGLLPGYLGQAWGSESVPLTALLTGSIVGCSVLLFLWLLFPKAIDRLFGLCMLSSCTVYVCIFMSFLIARDRLDTVPRTFVSPLGKFGAYYGMVIFSVMAVALSIFQDEKYVSLIVYLVAIVLAVVHYVFVARKREFLSLEEQAQFMKAYLLHSDAEYRRRMVRRSFKNKHAFLRKVAPFSYPSSGSKFAGLGQRWRNSSLVTAPIELLNGSNGNNNVDNNNVGNVDNNVDNNISDNNVNIDNNNNNNNESKKDDDHHHPPLIIRRDKDETVDHSHHKKEEDTAVKGEIRLATQRKEERHIRFDQQDTHIHEQDTAGETQSRDTPNNNNNNNNKNSVLLLRQQQDTSLKPHQLHLQSSLLLTTQELQEQQRLRAAVSQEYNANQHQMTLELEQKMKKLAEEIFAGHDEGHVTIVRSRHGRRALTFKWRETETVGVSSSSECVAETTQQRIEEMKRNVHSTSGRDKVEKEVEKEVELRSAADTTSSTSFSTSSPNNNNNNNNSNNNNSSSNSNNNNKDNTSSKNTSSKSTSSDRVIRLAETDTAVEIIPGFAEDFSFSAQDDAYSAFYPAETHRDTTPGTLAPSSSKHKYKGPSLGGGSDNNSSNNSDLDNNSSAASDDDSGGQHRVVRHLRK